MKRCVFKLHPQKFMSSQVNECTEVYRKPDVIPVGTDYNSSKAYGKTPNYTKCEELDHLILIYFLYSSIFIYFYFCHLNESIH